MSGWYPPSSRPRAVEDGLKARSTRGDIGTSWWSRRFLDVLESFAIGGRLARGKTYARKGQVMSLEIVGRSGHGRGAGVARRAVRRHDHLRAADRATEWDRVEGALADQALPCAKLLAGEVPTELESIFAAAGSPLFPAAVGDLRQDCSCPDWGVPCKHLAATFYLLAEAFDSDPFLLLRWRGREREELLATLRMLRSGHASDGDHQPTTTPTAGAHTALAGLDWPGDRHERFWQPPPPLPVRPPVLSAAQDVVLRQLPEPDRALGGAELVAQLRRVYRDT